MNKEQLITLLRNNEVRKLTGPVEHWLTTYSDGFWGLDHDKKSQWSKIKPGDLFVFHGSGMMHDPKTKVETGIIGVGICSGIREKRIPVWLGELHAGVNGYPYLIDFEEVWWLGDTNQIEKASIAEKLKNPGFKEGLHREVSALTKNCVSFREMRQHNCPIANQGTYQRLLTNKSALINLIASKLGGSNQYENLPSPPQNRIREIEAPSPSADSVERKRRNISFDYKPDYEALNARNADTGLSGEKLIFELESERVKAGPLAHLIDQVKHVSLIDDSLGYDILSLDDSGNPIHIEVKTTTSNSAHSKFYLSACELEFAMEHPDSFRLIRVFNFDSTDSSKASWYVLDTEQLLAYKLTPTNYEVTP